MANEQNLIPFEKGTISKEEAQKNGRKGGINSGKSRRQKANLRKAVQAILTSEFTGKKNGKIEKMTGEEIIIQGLMQNLANYNGKNWGKAMDIFISLIGDNLSNEQKAKLKAETKLIEAKTNLLIGNKDKDNEKINNLIEALKEL